MAKNTKFRYSAVIVKIAKELNYTIEEIMDKPSDWIALVYKEIVADEAEKYKIVASFFGIKIKDKKNAKGKKNIPMTQAQMKALGFGYKREK